MQGLGQVVGLDGLAAVQVGNGAGHPADAVVAPGGEPHAVKGPLHNALAGLVQLAEFLQGALVQGPVAPGAAPSVLDAAGLVHPLLDFGGGFPLVPAGELVKLQGGDLHKQVDAVQQGAGEAGEVALHLRLGAAATPRGVAVPAAFAGVHGAHQHELAGVGHRPGGPGDLDPAVLHGLAQHLQHVLLKLGQLIQEEHSVVGQGNFSRLGVGPAPGHAHGGDAVVGGAEGAAGDEGVFRPGEPQHRVDLRHGQGLFPGHIGEDGRQALGQHGLARPRRAHH